MLTLAIIGRPNVGKSTLFNRLAGKRFAIVHDSPGITRDWREAEGWLGNQTIRLFDTAGLEEVFDESIQGKMRRQTEEAMARADAVLFLLDGRAGITPMDQHFASWLRRQKKPVILAVNKCENERATVAAVAEANALGFGAPIPISSAHGEGIGDLSDAFEALFPLHSDPSPPLEGDAEKEDDDLKINIPDDIDALEGNLDYDLEEPAEEEKSIKIAIVGRPNVGKSTLLNALLNDNRVMTSPEAGTTRDAIAVEWTYAGRAIRLVDTAGLRKKARVTDTIEKMSTDDTLRAIRLAQVVILVIDAGVPMEKQDLQIADHILKEGRAMILAVNKWDSVKGKEDILEELHYKLNTALAQVRNVPIATISALHSKNLDRMMDTVLATYDLWNKRVSTGKLNRWLAGMESRNPAPLVDGRPNRLKYMAQINIRPPTFALWVSRSKEMPEPYKRYIMNGLREDFGIDGIAIRLLLRASKNPFSNK